MAPHGYIGVVGESHYQDALKHLLVTAVPNRIVTVGVEREPSNPFDPKAIRVFDPATGRTLGHLPRGTTGFVRLLKEHGIQCHAELKGGTSDKPSVGLVLHLHGEQQDPEKGQQPQTRTVGKTVEDTRMSDLGGTAASASEVKPGGMWSFLRRIFRGGR